jgi:hypothetical protein
VARHPLRRPGRHTRARAARCSCTRTRATYEPTKLTIACGDGGALLTGLKWHRWRSTRAVATGVWKQHDCKPFCAGSMYISYPVNIVLREPLSYHRLRIFGRLVATFPKSVPPYPAYKHHRLAIVLGPRYSG